MQDAVVRGQTALGWMVLTPDDAASLEADRVRLRLPAATTSVATSTGR